jgi:pterin-4a-carbinolamine dehydratase
VVLAVDVAASCWRWTYNIDELTESDFIMAANIDRFYPG